MKKNFFLLMVLTSSVFVSCSTEDKPANEGNSSDLGNSSARLSANITDGEIHNDFMNFMHNGFQQIPLSSNEEGLDYIVDMFDYESKEYQSISPEDLQDLNASIEDNKEFLNVETIHGIINGTVEIDNPIRQYKTPLSVLASDLREVGVMSEGEYVEVAALQEELKIVFSGEADIRHLRGYLDSTAKRVSGQDYKMLESMLSIGASSDEWWSTTQPGIFLPGPGEINPSDPGYVTYLAPVVGTDIAGAVGGALLTAGAQYYFNGEVDWRLVGAGAVGGAITASTGIYGKVGKWLSGLF